MTQAECAKEMGIARATVQSLYTETRKNSPISGGSSRTTYSWREFFNRRRYVRNGRGKKGVYTMKIAVTYENGEVFQHFSHTEQFKIYHVEDGKIISAEVVDTNGSGHGALAGFLKEKEQRF